MAKTQDWLEIIEKASQPKKGTKIPKGMTILSLSLSDYPSPMQSARMTPGGMSPNGLARPFNTGAGADGVVQPSKPVMLDQTTTPPSVYHEGENVYPFPGGKKIVPANTEQQQADLAMKQQEENLPGYQTGGTVYEDPNSITPTTGARPTNVYDLSAPQTQQFQSGVNQAFQTTQQRAAGTDPLMNNITNRALQDYDIRAATTDTATRQQLNARQDLTDSAKRAVIAKNVSNYRSGLSGLVGDLSAQSMQRAEAANRELYDMGRTGVQDEQSRQQFEKTFGEQQYQSDVGRSERDRSFAFEREKYGDQEFGRMADDAQTTSLETWLVKYPNATEADYNIAREYKQAQLDAMGVATATASENLIQLKDSARWKDAEQFLRAGDYENYAAIVKEITGRDIDYSDFQEDRSFVMQTREQQITMGDIQIDSARLGVDSTRLRVFVDAVNSGADRDAANALSGLNLTPEQFKSISTQYEQKIRAGELAINAQEIDNEAQTLGVSADRLRVFIDAVNSGSDLDSANAASGLNLTRSQYLQMREGYSNKTRLDELAILSQETGIDSTKLGIFVDAINSGLDISVANERSGLNITPEQANGIVTQFNDKMTANEIALDGARNALGDDLYASIVTMIEGGSTLSAVNQRLAEQGKRPINRAEYLAMRNVSGVGDKEWERTLQGANMLLQSQDPDNIRQAATVLDGLFPGVTFDFNQLANDVGAERFAQGMTDLGTLANMFDTWSEARDSAGGLKLMSMFRESGMGEGDVANLFHNLKINAIDEEWDAINESDWYKSLISSDPDAAELVQTTFTKGLTGELEFDVAPVFNIMDSNGDFVKSFSSVEDANAFLGENAASGYTMERDLNYIYKDLTTGDTVVVNNGTGSSTVPGDGSNETVQTVAARFAKLGSDYTEEDVQAYFDANGKLPTDTSEMKAWDDKQYNINYWDRLATSYPDGNLMVGGRATISSNDLTDLVTSKREGDARADAYFTTDEDMERITSAHERFKSSEGRGFQAKAFAEISQNVRDTMDYNVGKIILVKGKPYIIAERSDEQSFGLYNPETKQTKYYDIRDVLNKGFDETVRLG